MKPIEVACLIAFGNPEQAKAGVQHLRESIAKGGDVNEIEDGATALCVLMSANQKEINRRDQESAGSIIYQSIDCAVKILIEEGANPWLGDPCAWELDQILQSLMILRARASCSHKFKGPDGGNDLHYFLRRGDHIFDSLLDEFIDEHLDFDWLNERDQMGRTPLHVLWDRECMGMEEDDERISITCKLIRRGALLEIKDHAGQSVAELILKVPGLTDYLDENDPEDTDFLGKVISIQQQQRLLEAVFPASSERLGIRL